MNLSVYVRFISTLAVGLWLVLFSTATPAQDKMIKEGLLNNTEDHPVSAINPEKAQKVFQEENIESDRKLPEIKEGQPMTMKEALAAVDKRNLSLKAARVELEKAKAASTMVLSRLLPVVAGQLSYTHHDHEDKYDMGEIPGLGDMGSSLIMPQEELNGSLSVSLPVIAPSAWLGLKSSKKAIAAAESSLEVIRQELLFSTAKAFYVAIMAKQLIELHENAIDTCNQHLRVAHTKLVNGIGTRIDVLRAETDRDQAYQQLLSAHLAFDNARDALRWLTGVDTLPMPMPPSAMSAPLNNEESLVKEATANRSDIKNKQTIIALKRSQLNETWMQFLPTLNGSWQGSYQFSEMGEMGSNDRSRWLLMLNLSIPIYNHYRYADLDMKRAEVRKAQIEEENTMRRMATAVRTEQRNYLSALASVEIAEHNATLAREALSITETLYEAGTGSSLEVTDARRTALNADVSLATKRLESQIALLSLLHSIGRDMSRLK